MLVVNQVTKYYDDFCAVDNLSFEIGSGEIFGLLGLNGAGKTTTFRMILGLLDDYEGEILFDGKKVDYSVTDKIGFLTEERSLLTKLRVIDQIKYYGILQGMSEGEIEGKLDYWLERFKISDYKYKRIKELSKGNQQKIQFISAIIHDPKLLILDEPFSGLDPLNVELFKEVILEFKKKGASIIFSSHRMEHVEMFCEKLLVLVNGKTVLSGYLKDIKANYKKKRIIISGDVLVEELEKVEGVVNISKENEQFVVYVEDDKYINNLFKAVSKFKNISKFMVEDASLNEIFINTVGEAYE